MTIIHLRQSGSAADRQALIRLLTEQGLPHLNREPEGDPRIFLEEVLVPPRLLGALRAHPAVAELETTEELPGRVLRGETEVGTRPLIVGEHRIDFAAPEVIAGPCVVESPGLLDEIAARLAGLGIRMLRGGGDKIRSSPRSFRGLGLPGYGALREVSSRYGMVAVGEVVDSPSLEEAAACLDVLQIGTRNMHNPHFLERVAGVGKPVLLKRGFAATYSEWLWAGEYVLAAGAPFVLFCERGIRTFSPMRRFTLDIQAIPFLREMTAFPVLADPSHAAGSSPLVPPLAKAAAAAGAHGLLVECHPHPIEARCDALQALTLDTFEELLRAIRPDRAARQTEEPATPRELDPTPRDPRSCLR